MTNKEKKIKTDHVHVLLALARRSQGEESNCIRSVYKGTGNEIDFLEAKLKIIGGYWRIYMSVNARDVEKARKKILTKLINCPEKASYVDSEWRTALLQKDCIYGQKRFMLDIDTEDAEKIEKIEKLLFEAEEKRRQDFMRKDYFPIKSNDLLIINKIKSPKGWHYITLPFDTREICKLEYVSLLRDGYYFIKEVGERKIKK